MEKAGRQIADAIAEKKGAPKKVEKVSSSLGTPGHGLHQETKTGKCQG